MSTKVRRNKSRVSKCASGRFRVRALISLCVASFAVEPVAKNGN